MSCSECDGELTALPPLRSGVNLGCRACCGLGSVHRLPRPRGYTSGIASHAACRIALGP